MNAEGLRPILETSDVAVNFGGVRAVDGVSLTVLPGEIHGLIGPNGSGKTTFLNAVTGFVEVQRGEIRLDGAEITRWSVHRRALAGISRTFQGASIFSEMTAIENVVVGLHAWDRQTWARSCIPGVGDRIEAHDQFEASLSLKNVGLGLHTGTVASDMGFVQQRSLDLARAISGRPRLLLMDEPAAGLTPTDVEELAATIRRLRSDGWTILLVEHHMRFVMGLCDVVSVLDFGRQIAAGTPSENSTGTGSD